MNVCLLCDENLSNAQRNALNKLTLDEWGFSIDQQILARPLPVGADYNKYHGAVFELQHEANRIAKLLQRAKRAAKDEKAGHNHARRSTRGP